MSEKLRSVNTHFWDDPFIEELSPSEKLLFLYLLTNPLTNLLGVYEITLKRICYDTGLSRDMVSKGFESFAKGRKAFFTNESFVILPNWLKNQRLNANMKIAVSKEFRSLPNNLKDSILSNGSERLGNDSEGFRMIMECLGKYEIEIEDEIESEDEDEATLIKSYKFYAQEVKKAKEYTDPMSKDYVKYCNHVCQKKDDEWRLPFVLKIKNQISLNEFSQLYEKAGKNLDLILTKVDSLQTNVKYHGKYIDLFLTINKWLCK